MSEKKYIILTLKEFEKGVLDGTLNDNRGIARLIIHGLVSQTYNVYIDRRIVTHNGATITAEALIKRYGKDNIKIQYELKETHFPKLMDYRTADNLVATRG